MGPSYLARVITAANVTRDTFAFNLRQRVAEKQDSIDRCKSMLADMPDNVPAFICEDIQHAITEYTEQLVILQGALAYVQDGDTSGISASDIERVKYIK